MHDGRVSTRQVRLAKTVVAGLVIGLGVANLWFSITGWTLSDASAYWEAAHRLREGGELYPAVANVEASNVYRYAPWFAWLAIPFTYLPVQVAGALWSLVLVAASTAAVIPMARRGALLQVAFFFPILIGISAVGNAQALMVAWLVWGVERRSGPIWIALAASLKAVPLLLALVYLGRREWLRAVLCVVFTALLVAPGIPVRHLALRDEHRPGGDARGAAGALRRDRGGFLRGRPVAGPRAVRLAGGGGGGRPGHAALLRLRRDVPARGRAR